MRDASDVRKQRCKRLQPSDAVSANDALKQADHPACLSDRRSLSQDIGSAESFMSLITINLNILLPFVLQRKLSVRFRLRHAFHFIALINAVDWLKEPASCV